MSIHFFTTSLFLFLFFSLSLSLAFSARWFHTIWMLWLQIEFLHFHVIDVTLLRHSERPRSLLLSLGGSIQTLAWVLSWARPGPIPSPRCPVQIRHVLCFTVFRTHPGPEVGAIPARPGPILLPSVPYRIGPGRAETDFLATSETYPTPLARNQYINSSAGFVFCICTGANTRAVCIRTEMNSLKN